MCIAHLERDIWRILPSQKFWNHCMDRLMMNRDLLSKSIDRHQAYKLWSHKNFDSGILHRSSNYPTIEKQILQTCLLKHKKSREQIKQHSVESFFEGHWFVCRDLNIIGNRFSLVLLVKLKRVFQLATFLCEIKNMFLLNFKTQTLSLNNKLQ